MRQFGKTDRPLKYLFGLLMSGLIVWSFLVPDDPEFQHPAAARIFFWHFPCPMMLTVFMFLGCYFSLRYFVDVKSPHKLAIRPEQDARKRELWDLKACSALEIGLIFAILTLVSGMLFSSVTWGALWQSDPRQTSFLLALLIYGGYFALRSAFSDPIKRAASCAAYMLAATLPLTFLIFVFPRLPQIAASSFHPTNTIMEGRLQGQYGQVIVCLLIMVTILATWIYRMRVKVGLLLLKQQHGTLEIDRGRSRPTVMVRPVRLSHED
jgi:heme exporter protein C